MNCATRHVSASVAFFASMVLLPTSNSQGFPQAKQSPNIVMIIADDLGWNDVGYNGSEIKTPNIDALALEGVRLENYYVHPLCVPSRAALLSGRPPSRLGVHAGNAPPVRGGLLPAGVITLAEFLRRNGYSTAITGKWHLGSRPETGPNQYGFENSYGALRGEIDPFLHRYKHGDPTWHRDGNYIEEEGHATDLISREATHLIDRLGKASKPFFLYVAFTVPHIPLDEERQWIEPYEGAIENESRRLFAASVTHMDDSIGKIRRALRQQGLEKETLLFFFSDNGGKENSRPNQHSHEGRHGPYDRLADNRPWRGWKEDLYEGGIHVPAVFAWPGTLQTRQVSELVTIYDIYPTLAHLIGAPLSEDSGIEGINVWAAIQGEKLNADRTIYWRARNQMALRMGRWKILHFGATLTEGGEELYDLDNDPYERNNLVATRPSYLRHLEILTKLRTRLAEEVEKDEMEMRKFDRGAVRATVSGQ